MKGDRLYDVVAFILNEASDQELEVVRSALKRRIEGTYEHGAMGVDPERMARGTASAIQEQLGGSIEQIRSMVTKFAVDIIRKDAPELTDEQVRDLLAEWIPSSGRRRRKPAGAKRAPEGSAAPPDSPPPGGAASSRKGGKRLAPDVILTMATQFLAYGDESMSVSDQVKLNREIPDWQRRYWEQFSPRIRQLLSLHLRGEIDRSTCLERICADLGIDADLSG